MKRSRGDRDAPGTSSKPTGQQHLYLIFDDCELGYSIRELNLSNAGGELPPPFVCLEARRSLPQFFAAVGTKILATHPREDFRDILPMIDVRSRGISFAPGELYPQRPIYLPVGDDEIFALDMGTFKILSMKPLSPPRLEDEDDGDCDWSWRDLPMPPFSNLLRRRGLRWTNHHPRQHRRRDLRLRPVSKEWEKRAEWSLPFTGRAYFVHGLDVFVGLPKDEDDFFGHLCFCRWSSGGDDDKHEVCFSKENLSSKDPAESHVGTALVYLGESMFCIVEHVRNGDDRAVHKWMEERGWKELDHTEEGPLSARCCLTTFSLSSDTNGVLTAAETAVKCYKVPGRASFYMSPVAFWL